MANASDPDGAIDQHAYADRPFYFGNDVIDQMVGIEHLAENAETLLTAPGLPKTDAPAIAVGAGPSLSYATMLRLKELQHSCLIVCCDTAYKGLVAAGVHPHIITPLERHPSVLRMIPESCSGIFAGTPVCVPEAVRRFQSHVFAPGHDPVYDWCCLPDDRRYVFGSSTGTMAAHIAAEITTGPVFLLGHDLCYGDNGKSHWSQATSNAMSDVAVHVPCVDGAMRPSSYWWVRFRKQLGDLAGARGNMYNCNWSGATIENAQSSGLPVPGDPLVLTPGVTRPERLAAWKSDARNLASDAAMLLGKIQAVTAISDTDIVQLVPGRNGQCLAYLLQSICAQMSYELRLGRSRSFVLEWHKTAIANALKAAMPILERISREAA